MLAFLAVGCPGQKPPTQPQGGKKDSDGPVAWKLSKSGLGFRISNADADADNPPERKVAAATPLGADDAKKLAQRLPALKVDPDDEKDFSMRAKSIPAPRPGKTVTEQFPPPPVPPPNVTPPAGPLKVERRAPEGPVPIAPHLSMTFTQPMVAVTSVDELSKEHPPVRLVPEPPGKWRWLGTRTLMFAPEKRFPMATEYTVEVPAGTKGANGQVLAAAEKWTFTTPAPVMKAHHPTSTSEPLEPILFAEFDQGIDDKAMLGSIELSAGKQAVPIRLAGADEIEGDDAVRRLSQNAEKGRWIAFRPVSKLSTSTSFNVRIKQGAPSAEGPRKTDKEQSYHFTTFGPMRVADSKCSTWVRGKEVCTPLTPFFVTFSNPVDLKVFEKSMVTVSPEIPGMKIEVHGNMMIVSGRTKGRTKYTMNVAGAIGDVHKQTMGETAKLTFDVGPAEPMMFGPESLMAVLDPAGPKEYLVHTVNEPGLRTRVYAVTPEDWGKYVAYSREWERPRKLAAPGRLVYDKLVTPKKQPDELVSTPIDLGPALSGGLGQALVVVEPTHPLAKDERRTDLHVWVQSTEIGLSAFIEQDQVTGWATRLSDGAALADVDVSLLGAGTAKTDASGLARVLLGSASGKLVVGRKGKDVVIVPEQYFNEASYVKQSVRDYARWFVFDDRGIYKPGEEVRVKGWVRRSGGNRGGDLDAVPGIAGKAISFVARDPRGAELTKGKATADEFGGFDFTFKLPGNANLGHAHVEMRLESSPIEGEVAHHPFQVQEFRRPEFEVTAKSSEGPHYVGKNAIATLTAAYYSGGGLPDAAVHWTVTRSTTGFTPPNRSDYHFGPEPIWFWSEWSHGPFMPFGKPREDTKSETWESKTNPQGIHRIRLDFDALEPSYPMNLALTGAVDDVNRQQWAGRTSMLVHPAEAYVGFKPAKNFVRAGENIDMELVVTDIDGKAMSGRHVVVKAGRVETEQKGIEFEEKEVDVQTCEVDSPKDATPSNEKVHCGLKTTQGGKWRVTANVTDAQGRKNQSTTIVWVMGNDAPKKRGLVGDKANLVLDKKEYKPGDLAEVLVVAPFAPAEGILTVRRQGIVHIERFSMKTLSQAFKVKLEDAMVPNVEMRVDLVGQDVRLNPNGDPDPSLPKRPAFASGTAPVTITPSTRTLDVKAVAKQANVAPGASTQIEVDVKDPSGRPAANAEVALVVADESVLALTGYKTPDPIAVFYTPRGPEVRELGMRDRVLLGNLNLGQNGGRRNATLNLEQAPREFAAAQAVGGGGMASTTMAPPPPPAPMAPVSRGEAAGDNAEFRSDAAKKVSEKSVVGNETSAIAARTDFSAVALFSPRLKTDAKGHVSVPMKLPDNLTRYRVMALAATTGREFGSNESTITARLPLMVRPSAPRFLNFGDKFELPVVIQNQTDAEIEAGVVVRATNALVPEPSAKRVKIPANDRVEVRFTASTVKAGTARFQIGTAAPGFSDASQVELPVYTPATTEAFATYGEIDDGAIAQPMKMPPGVFPQFGGLEITTSSTQVQALTDAVLYLAKYPFECNEQIASRVIAIAALRDVLSAFKAKDLPSKEALIESMKTDFEKLKRHQHHSGGWGFWQETPWPYLSVHVAHALVRAKEKGYKPDEAMLQRSQQYLRQIESHIPSWYGDDARRSITAYALYVRKRMGDADVNRAKRLMTEAGGVDKLPIEAVGWIWPTISADANARGENEAIRRHVANRVTETAGAAHFVSGYKDSNWVLLHSDRRADGVLLESMIGDQKDSTVIPKLVKGLLGHRKGGHWENTQENAFVLLSLDKYFATYEKVTPDFVARAWLGDRFAGEHAFKGRTTEFSHIGIPMQFLATEVKAPQNLILGKEGPGRLYYRIGMQYAPTDLKLPPADNGFVVSRVYEGVDSPNDVKRDPDGTWRTKAGNKVRVRVTMVAPSRRYHVALVDSLPAGLEAMNPSLAVTGEIPKDPKAEATKGGRFWMWERTWYEHQNMRDERVEAFASLVWDGVWDYSYVARATTPGTFVVPPAKAEEMYSPETFGRSGGDKFVVE